MTTYDKASDRPAIVLFRFDLRLADNGALRAAVDSGRPVIPVFVLDEMSEGVRKLGGARRWWLHGSLASLASDIDKAGGRLILRRGPLAEVAAELVEKTGAALVTWNRSYDPPVAAAEKALARSLSESEVEARAFDGQLLHDPSKVKTGTGSFYKVYTPFQRALFGGLTPRAPHARPREMRPFHGELASDALDDWGLLPTRPDWAGGLRATWTPGEAGAHAALEAFLSDRIRGYADDRDRPDREGTSRLSPHLTHGEITPYQLWHALETRSYDAREVDMLTFRKELVWREFSYHVLHHNPQLGEVNFNSDFDRFAWQKDRAALLAWQSGRTGYPFVDAAMRQLWTTGWIQNRARMVAASFLVKHLLQDWRAGEAWYWDTLVDADPANNTGNWQWVAGSGADAAPFFRVFNPTIQGRKFDPDAAYVHAFVPELAKLGAKEVHDLEKASPKALSAAGVKLGTDYPVAVVDHAAARERALQTFKDMRGNP